MRVEMARGARGGLGRGTSNVSINKLLLEVHTLSSPETYFTFCP